MQSNILENRKSKNPSSFFWAEKREQVLRKTKSTNCSYINYPILKKALEQQCSLRELFAFENAKKKNLKTLKFARWNKWNQFKA